jgi:serine/threonine protein kinase
MARDEPTEDAEPDQSSAPSPLDARSNEAATWRGRRFGPYEPVVEIARGGMGAVFAAHAHGGPAAGNLVALKLLRRDLAATHRRAFLREARITSSLDHPNVVRTLDVGEAGDDVYLAMELVMGVTLAQLLARLDDRELAPSPWASALVVARAARGLHAAHELRAEDGTSLDLVHRDISPQNILLDFDGRVLLADFGIAKFAHDGTTSVDGTLKGKFSYMSPEQIRADALDRRSDVFGLGAVLYEALTGGHAFSGRGPAEIVAQVLHGGVHDPREKRADLPENMARVVARCLATEREDRYATVAEVAADLEVALADAPEPPEEILSAALEQHFAKERGRFERLRRREVWSAKTTPASAVPRAVVIDDPPTLETGDRRPQATLASANPAWAPRREPRPALTPPSVVHVSEAPPLPSPWGGRITWMLGAVAALVAASALVLAARTETPVPTTPSASAAPSPSAPASPTSPAVRSPEGASTSAGTEPAASPSVAPEVRPEAALPAPPASSAIRPTGKPAPQPPKPRPSAAPSGGVFRDW